MIEFTSLLAILHPLLEKTILHQLVIITEAVFQMTGRITMLGISRWSRKVGSYRTIQRFFKTKIEWLPILWKIIETYLLEKNEPILLAGDTTVVTKSGKKTHGLGWFFSSSHNKVLHSLSFQVVSVISTKRRKSYPIMIEQLQYDPKKENKEEKTVSKKKRGRGRPKGSKNKNRKDVVFSKTMLQLKNMLEKVLKLLSSHQKPTYFLYDGVFGNNNAVQMTQQFGLHLISKLRYNSQLYFLFDGKYSGRGRPRIYGNKVDFSAITAKYLQQEMSNKKSRIQYFNFIARHKKFADSINIVVILKTDLKTKKTSRVILFSTDLELHWEKIVDYYRLRFQIALKDTLR